MLLTRSARLGDVRHGFSTRRGGVSEGRYASLNVGAKWGDEPARVDENRRRLAAAGGFALERLYTATQVHGAAIAVVDGSEITDIASVKADGLIACTPGVAVGVYTADCVPILISDGAGRVAAVHAGWRGTVAGVARAAVDALVGLGASRDALSAALGPSICVGCFEVGDEVAAQFGDGQVERAPGRKAHVDLRRANRAQLAAAGVRRIDDAPPCTMCDRESYFSFRRDGARIGQHLSFIVAGIVAG
jgi:polyphenol oxidase